MSTNSARKMQALEACDKVINGIEEGTITVLSSLLQCKKIARLVNDFEGQEWLGFEYGGYPRDENGYILHNAWQIGAKHGRSYQTEDKSGKYNTCIFSELCGELEELIESNKKAINNYSTQGFSVSTQYASLATQRMTSEVALHTNILLQKIQKAERQLSILKSQYYDYAIKWKIELCFGSTAQKVFEEYQEKVDQYFSLLPVTTLQKLGAIKDLLEDGNPERYAQLLTSCRRLWNETAKVLFSEVLPGYSEKTFKTKNGKEIDITGNHDNNKLSAVIETLQSKTTKNTLVGSETIYLIDWMEQINNMQNIGVHAAVTREQAMQCIIHTYIALGDILVLKNNVVKTSIACGAPLSEGCKEIIL